MNMRVVSYGPATAADAAQMAAVQIAAWRDCYAGFLPAEMLLALDDRRLTAALQGALAKPDAFAVSFTARYHDRILGFCHAGSAMFSEAEGSTEIFHLAVDPDVQDQAIGTALFVRTADRLRDLGGRALVVKTWAQNQIALSMFSKLGAELRDHETAAPAGRILPTRQYVWPDIELLFDRLEALVGDGDRTLQGRFNRI